MQKTSRINSDKSSLTDNQKERKLTTPNRRNNTVASRDASDTPTQHIDHPRSSSATDTAPRPPTQRIGHRAMPRPPAQCLDHPRNASTNAQHLVHRHSASSTDTAPRPPMQHLDHRHSTSTIRTAPRPSAQHLDRPCSTSTNTQRIDRPRHPLTTPSRPIEQIFALFLSAWGQNSTITHCFT